MSSSFGGSLPLDLTVQVCIIRTVLCTLPCLLKVHVKRNVRASVRIALNNDKRVRSDIMNAHNIAIK